jgi:hypothetical protein
VLTGRERRLLLCQTKHELEVLQLNRRLESCRLESGRGKGEFARSTVVQNGHYRLGTSQSVGRKQMYDEEVFSART